MWRWSQGGDLYFELTLIFSTYVEVILMKEDKKNTKNYFLHVCGGDPHEIDFLEVLYWFSPRMWRWSQLYTLFLYKATIFSTYVEVIPGKQKRKSLLKDFLHVCGGDPMVN